jgi:hypothetical protein
MRWCLEPLCLARESTSRGENAVRKIFVTKRLTGSGDLPINRLTERRHGGERKRNGGSDGAEDENLVALRGRKDYIDVSPWRAGPGRGRRDGRMRLWSRGNPLKSNGSCTSEKHWRRDTRPAVWSSVEGHKQAGAVSRTLVESWAFGWRKLIERGWLRCVRCSLGLRTGVERSTSRVVLASAGMI